MKNFLYLEPDEEIDSIIRKIKRSKEKSINLVVPLKSVLFSKKNLEAVNKLGKKITIHSNDSSGLFLAKENGIAIATEPETNQPKKTEKVNTAPSLKKIKIVYKKTTTSSESGAKKEEKTVSSTINKTETPNTKQEKTNNQPSLFSQLVLGTISIISIIIIILVFLLVVPKTDISITTQAQKVSLDTTVTLDTKQTNVDFINSVVPAQLVNIEEELVQEERATGELNGGQKATGIITLYNQSGAGLPLVGNSRFVTADGLVFRSTASVDVPAGGNANINVVADFIGSKGNVGPSKFTLPALPGLESIIYGQSNTTFSGGSDDITYVISENDIQYSMDEIRNKIYEKAVNDLKTKLPSDRRYISLPADQLNISVNPDHQVGDQVDSFNIIAKATVPFLVYQHEDFLKIIKNHIDKNLQKNRSIADDQYENYNQQILNADVNAGYAVVNLTASALTTSAYNLESIKKDLVGKSEEEVKTYFLNDQYSEIQQIETKFWPDWVKRVSKIPSRINIDVIYK